MATKRYELKIEHPDKFIANKDSGGFLEPDGSPARDTTKKKKPAAKKKPEAKKK